MLVVKDKRTFSRVSSETINRRCGDRFSEFWANYVFNGKDFTDGVVSLGNVGLSVGIFNAISFIWISLLFLFKYIFFTKFIWETLALMKFVKFWFHFIYINKNQAQKWIYAHNFRSTAANWIVNFLYVCWCV